MQLIIYYLQKFILFFLPIAQARPTQPRPNIATVEFGSTFAVFNTAPYPVVIPHPNKQTRSNLAILFITATDISATTF